MTYEHQSSPMIGPRKRSPIGPEPVGGGAESHDVSGFCPPSGCARERQKRRASSGKRLNVRWATNRELGVSSLECARWRAVCKRSFATVSAVRGSAARTRSFPVRGHEIKNSFSPAPRPCLEKKQKVITSGVPALDTEPTMPTGRDRHRCVNFLEPGCVVNLPGSSPMVEMVHLGSTLGLQ